MPTRYQVSSYRNEWQILNSMEIDLNGIRWIDYFTGIKKEGSIVLVFMYWIKNGLDIQITIISLNFYAHF